MFEELLNIVDKLESFSFVEEEKKIIPIEDDEILSLVRGQMSLGQTGSGKPITYEGRSRYSRYSQEIKQSLGLEYRWITLRMTGQFWASLFVLITQDGKFTVSSSDIKYPMLRLKTPEDTLSLNVSNLQYVQTSANSFLQQAFDKHLGL